MRHQNFFAKSCKFFLISSLIYAGGGSLEAFVKLNSWPADFTAPTDSAYLEIGGKKFENIPSKIFKDAAWIEDLAFDSSIQNIGQKAFENCTALTSIMFPQQLAQIGPTAFKGCSKIKELILPEQLKSIGSEAFAGTQLTSIAFPSSLTHLEPKAFSGCQLKDVSYKSKTNDVWVDSTFFRSPDSTVSLAGNQDLEELIILQGTTQIPENAFAGCSNLRYVSFPSTLTAVGLGAFDGCTNLEFIDYGDQTDVQDLLLDTVENGEVVGKTLFAGTTSVKGKYAYNQTLNTLIVLNSVQNLGYEAFKYCKLLKSVILPSSLTFLDTYALAGCQALNKVILPNSITKLNVGVFAESALQEATLPKSVTEISSNLFFKCYSLKSAVLPDCLISIGNSSFESCSSLQSITPFPQNLTNIGNKAFLNCSSLKKIDISQISFVATQSINWLAAFNQDGLNRITKVICRQEQVEKVKEIFPNATPKIVA